MGKLERAKDAWFIKKIKIKINKIRQGLSETCLSLQAKD
jgi:hypothetical protein